MTNDGLLIKELTAHEGVRRIPCIDRAGKLTIGVARHPTDRGLSPA